MGAGWWCLVFLGFFAGLVLVLVFGYGVVAEEDVAGPFVCLVVEAFAG